MDISAVNSFTLKPLADSIGKFDGIFHPIEGLWAMGELFSFKNIMISKEGNDFQLTIGYDTKYFMVEKRIPQRSLDKLGLALMKTAKFDGDTCIMSFRNKNRAEVRDAMRELIRNQKTDKLTFLGNPDYSKLGSEDIVTI